MQADLSGSALSSSPVRWRSLVFGAALASVLGWFYCSSALEHARVVNTAKSRGDQSAYLWEAQIYYRNWHGLNDPPVTQPRNRMPLYPSFLATIYRPAWTDPEFFEIAREASVYLSLALVAITGAVAFRCFSPLPALNFTTIVAFGCFIFKAGYTQSELLFYTLHFLSFVACWQMLVARQGIRRIVGAAVAGVLAAVAFLTKAGNLPFAALVVAVAAGQAVVELIRTRRVGTVPGLVFGPAVVFGAAFLLILSPYLLTSKRIHGQYFYSLASVLVWYDDYPAAAGAMVSYGPDGWPPGPPSLRPGPSKYWREHSLADIGGRIGNGFRDMVAVSFRGFMFLSPLALYALAAALVVATRPSIVSGLVRRHLALAVFLLIYAGLYLPTIAFYEPTSGTGTARFLLAHFAPLLFALTALLTHPEVAAERWHAGGLLLTVRHFHWMVAVIWAADLIFVLPHRLMTTYGGF